MSYHYSADSIEPAAIEVLQKRLNARDLSVFNHNLYEYQKGVRSMALVTEKKQHVAMIKQRLEAKKIAYLISEIDKSAHTVNIFFGDKACIEVLTSFGEQLNKLSSLDIQQDYILGSMLGYHPVEQCKRYMSRLNKNKNKNKTIS